MSNPTVPPPKTATASASQSHTNLFASSQPSSTTTTAIPRRYSVFPRSSSLLYSRQSRTPHYLPSLQLPTHSKPLESRQNRPAGVSQLPNLYPNSPHTHSAHPPWPSSAPSSTPIGSSSTAPALPPVSVPSTSPSQLISSLPNPSAQLSRPVGQPPTSTTLNLIANPDLRHSRPINSHRDTTDPRAFPSESIPPIGSSSASAPTLDRSLPSGHDPHHVTAANASNATQKTDQVNRKTTRHQLELPPSSYRSPRKRQKRSFVWNFFRESEKDPNIAYCQICQTPTPRGRNLARNTTNLRKHLEHRHPDFVKQFRLSQPRPSSPIPTSPILPQSHNPHPSAAPGPPHMIQHTATRTPVPNAGPNWSASKSAVVDIPRPSQTLPVSTSSLPQQTRSTLGPPDSPKLARLSVKNPVIDLQTPHREERSKNPVHLNELPPLGVDEPFSSYKKVGNGVTNQGGNPANNSPLVPKVNVSTNDGTHRLTVENILSIIQVPLTRSQLEALQNLIDSAERYGGHNEMRMSLEPSLWRQVSVLQRKIRNGLSAANTIAVTVEKSGPNLFVLCHYYERRFDTRCVCVDVIPCSDMLDAADTSDTIDSDVSSGSDGQHCRMLGKLFQRIANNLSYWKIRYKVIGVVVAGRGVGCGRWRCLPEALTERNFDKNKGESPRCTWHKTGNEAMDNVSNRDGSGLRVWNDARIAVVPCLVDTLERIVTESICQHELFEKRFIVPLSELMFKALMDRSFVHCKKSKEWTSQVELPIRDVTLRSMVFIFDFVCENMGEIEKAVRKNTGNGEDTVLAKIESEEIKVVRDVLEAFSSAVAAIRIDDTNRECHRSWCCERSSAGLPIMRTLHERLEKLVEKIPDPMQYLVGLALHVVHNEWREMEKTEMHGCATLLDPRFKTEYFSSKEAVSNIVNIVVDLCDAERKRKLLSRIGDGRRSDGSAVRQVSGSNSGRTDSASGGVASWDNIDGAGVNDGNGEARRGENKEGLSAGATENPDSCQDGCGSGELNYLMDAIPPSQRVSASDVMVYLSEGRADLSQNVEEYWERNHLRWPFLTSVATRYSLIPCCCFGLERATKGMSVEYGADGEKGVGIDGSQALSRGLSNAAVNEVSPSGSGHVQSTARVADGRKPGVIRSGEELGREFLRSNLIIAESQLH